MKIAGFFAVACGLAVTAGCGGAPRPEHGAATPAPAMVGAVQLPMPRASAEQPLLRVSKNASCGCCELWIRHMRDAGFEVEVHDVDNLDPIKTRLGVPVGKGSCHTAEVAGYFIEGHVPAEDVRRLLAEKPDARGLVLPGMPLGSPGMEVPDGSVQPHTVELVARDGSTTPFARHGQ